MPKCELSGSPEFHGANFNSKSIPGIAIRAQEIKNPSQPMCFAKNPVGAEAITLGTAMRLVNSAYCVAVNFLLVIREPSSGAMRMGALGGVVSTV